MTVYLKGKSVYNNGKRLEMRYSMDYKLLQEKRDYLRQHIGALPQAALDNYDQDFAIRFTHNSTAIEGNTLTLMETKLLLEDKLSVGGKALREIYEVVNHDKAFRYVKACIAAGKPLDEGIVKDIHELLMENIQPGGIYRNVDVRIGGAQHDPPSPLEMYRQIKDFYLDLPYKADLNPIDLAAWTHAEFVRIHPFTDGNGRASRLIMNYQLMVNGFLPIDIPAQRRLEYYDALEQYAMTGNLTPFADMIAGLELPALDYYIDAIQMALRQEPEMEL